MAEKTINTKFYKFRQNNSGGKWIYNESRGITHFVFVEAIDADHANSRAEKIGLNPYEQYCPCCGARWDNVDELDVVEFSNILDHTYKSMRKEQKEIAIHHLDGKIEWMDK